MKRLPLLALSMLSCLLLSIWSPQAHAEKLKPFVLGKTPSGDMVTVVAAVSANLQAQGFTLIGTYTPYPAATVICATHDDLLTAAAGATNVLLVTFLIPISALLLGVGVLGEVIKVLEYIGMGCIFLGLIVIDGRALKWIKNCFNFRQEVDYHYDI